MAVAACTGTLADPHGGAAAGGDSTGSSGETSGGPSGGSSGGGGGNAPNLLPARIRRLTTAEYDASVKALLGVDSTYGASFTPDSRQDGFTNNDAQRVDPVFAMQIDAASQALAAQARTKLDQLAPCANPSDGATCARTFLGGFAQTAYRRPATTREIDALMAVYAVGAEGGTYGDGIQAVIQAVLVSPGFLYVTEIGDGTGAPLATMTSFETATALAYLFTGGPPDAALLTAATSNQLATGDQRSTQARRLLALPGAREQVQRVIEQWLGIDRITETSKDAGLYPDFNGLRDLMKKESDDFVSEVLWKNNGSVSELLSADWTIADPQLAGSKFYSSSVVNGRVSFTTPPRRGILNQGAFLSVYAQATETAPVRRGVAVMRRVTCIDVPSPASLNLMIVPPMPDPTKTTRERFDIHAKDPVCANCHKNIDSFGFAFENLDPMGKGRTEENGKKVDSSTVLATGRDFDGSYADSASMMAKIAASPSTRDCFARHMLKAAVGRSDTNETALESQFMKRWAALPEASQGSYGDVLVAWAGSDAFVQRRFDK